MYSPVNGISVSEAVYRSLRSQYVTMGRTLWHSDQLDLAYQPGQAAETLNPVDKIENANLISSRCPDGMHAPVLDIDIPHRVVPSSTSGHSHLYLDVSLSWRKYKRLLRELSRAGVIEEGFYKSALRRGQSMVRPPGVIKK